ncbi:hypothetical protein SAMN05421855_1146 [Ulvibacter litoralis]|uniref:Lipocalin-like domain-containing protein n=2 Tax=Ulvibacter litoralis TaxID=227084 RepID=A0A1G7JHG9_9FLAO|nr:hypothetical protein GCM10008083_33000 [Ulvibacter litoralis]SDF24370.1 hypothetical protein SAMN05421855_1146 [Ulvibacter litoralis]
MLTCTFGFGQVSPEDIIVVYDSINPKGKVLLKSEMSKNLDSINIHLLEDKKIELLTKKDSLLISKEIIGRWNLNSIKTSNGKPYNLQVFEKIELTNDGIFNILDNEEIISGKWEISKGELILNYNEPQCQIKDKALLKILPKEQIESLTYSSNFLNIRKIDNTNIEFMHFLPENIENIDEMFYVLVLSNYVKTE